MKDIRQQAEQKDVQKERILKQAEERMQKRIDSYLDKQKQAEDRLEKLKEHERIKEILRREYINLNNESKNVNKKRFMRKIQYKEERMRDKLLMEDLKIEAMSDQRSQLKQVRQKALSEMERQRQDIRNALYHMTVWNSFSPKIVEKICNQKVHSGNKPTIEEMVRKNASKEHLKQSLEMHRRTTSALHLRPISESQKDEDYETNLKSQRQFNKKLNSKEDDETVDATNATHRRHGSMVNGY